MLLLMAFLIGPPMAWAQSQPLPEIVVAVMPPGMIAMQPSSVTTVGFRTEPVTFEVQIQDATGQPVADDYFGPNTYFVVDVLLTNTSSGFIFSGPNSMATVNGIARFEAVELFVAPGPYNFTFTVRVVFAVDGLGSTSLTLGSVAGGFSLIGVQPTPTPSTTPFQFPSPHPGALTAAAELEGVATGLAATQQPTPFCPPNDPVGCNFPTSTPSATGTATAIPTPTLAPLIVPVDGDITVSMDVRGGSFQNVVSGPAGDTSDTIDIVFNALELTGTTTYTLTFTCPENTLAAASLAASGTVITCGRNSSITVSPVDNVVRVVVLSQASRDQTRTPYGLSIAPGR
jgi:hypothetical protein